jgi:hypothetical protein
VGFGDDGGVLQHGGVEGGEGGRLNEEEDGCRVDLLEEGGAAGRRLFGQILTRGAGPGARAPCGRGRGVKGVGWVCSGGRSWEQKGKGGRRRGAL